MESVRQRMVVEALRASGWLLGLVGGPDRIGFDVVQKKRVLPLVRLGLVSSRSVVVPGYAGVDSVLKVRECAGVLRVSVFAEKRAWCYDIMSAVDSVMLPGIGDMCFDRTGANEAYNVDAREWVLALDYDYSYMTGDYRVYEDSAIVPRDGLVPSGSLVPTDRV